MDPMGMGSLFVVVRQEVRYEYHGHHHHHVDHLYYLYINNHFASTTRAFGATFRTDQF